MVFWPHWLKSFSNWSKYNAKLSLNTKWHQISMECFHFFEQRFPRICLNKVPIVSIQQFILSIPDCHHINFQWFPQFPTIPSIPTIYYHNTCFSWKEFWGVTSQNGRDIPLCVQLLQRMTSYLWCFFVRAWTFCTLQVSYLVLTLFLHKIFF